jgi:hypothetical protein
MTSGVVWALAPAALSASAMAANAKRHKRFIVSTPKSAPAAIIGRVSQN